MALAVPGIIWFYWIQVSMAFTVLSFVMVGLSQGFVAVFSSVQQCSVVFNCDVWRECNNLTQGGLD
jgi:hypothetical protein